MNDRAVSEVIAFILVFSIVITSVGLLYTAGFGSISQIQEDETDRSAVRAFSASAVALEDIQRGRGEHRQFDLELSGRTLSINESTSLSVEIDDDPVSASADGALVYGPSADTTIAYQSGAVIRSDGPDAQIVSRAPQFRCTDDQAVVSLVTITGPPSSVSTDNAIEIDADGPQSSESTLVNRTVGTPESNELKIDYSQSPYAAAWEAYFEDEGWDSVDSDEATCSTGTVYVRHVPIDLSYENV